MGKAQHFQSVWSGLGTILNQKLCIYTIFIGYFGHLQHCGLRETAHLFVWQVWREEAILINAQALLSSSVMLQVSKYAMQRSDSVPPFLDLYIWNDNLLG